MSRPIPDRRANETLVDAARRCAIDAVYYERDHGGNMHTAGEAAADAVLTLLRADDTVDRAEKAILLTHAAEQRAYLSGEIERTTWRPREYAAAAVGAALERERSGSPTSGDDHA